MTVWRRLAWAVIPKWAVIEDDRVRWWRVHAENMHNLMWAVLYQRKRVRLAMWRTDLAHERMRQGFDE